MEKIFQNSSLPQREFSPQELKKTYAEVGGMCATQMCRSKASLEIEYMSNIRIGSHPKAQQPIIYQYIAKK
jgi:hypothetical protein